MIELGLSYSQEKLISLDEKLKFQLKGRNYALIVSIYNDKYITISNINFYFVAASYAVVLVFLSSDKFIGVETFNSLQMVFFSLLLIFKNSNFQAAFSTVLPLKYSTGFNGLIYEEKSFTNILDLSFNKYRYL